jgi:hypothetical protein
MRLFFSGIAGAVVVIFLVIEKVLEWMEKMEYIRAKLPGLAKIIESKGSQTVLLFVAIILLANVGYELNQLYRKPVVGPAQVAQVPQASQPQQGTTTFPPAEGPPQRPKQTAQTSVPGPTPQAPAKGRVEEKPTQQGSKSGKIKSVKRTPQQETQANPKQATQTQPPQTASTQAQPIGSISQGTGSALSIGQQGGVTAGTYLGNPPPQFSLQVVSANVKQDSSYETKFRIRLATSQAITMHVKVSAPSISDMKIDDERPPEQGGMSFMGTSKQGNGWLENDYWNIESGSYFIIVHTYGPENVKLECW